MVEEKSFFVLFLGIRSLRGIVIRNVIDDLAGSHAPIMELGMGLA